MSNLITINLVSNSGNLIYKAPGLFVCSIFYMNLQLNMLQILYII